MAGSGGLNRPHVSVQWTVRLACRWLADAPLPTEAMTDDFDAFIDDRLQAGSNKLYDESLARMERQLIIRVLRHTLGNRASAAEILGVTRTTLRTKLRVLGITVDSIGEDLPASV